MKKVFRHLSVLLCVCMCMALVSIPAMAESASAGGYIERELTMPEGYLALTPPVASPGGGIAVAAKHTDGLWDLLTWQDPDSEPVKTPLSLNQEDITSISIAPDGMLMAGVSPAMMNRMRTPGTPGKGPESGEEPGAEREPSDAPQVFTFSPESMKSTMAWFDPQGAEVARFEVSGMIFSSCALSEKRMAALDGNSGITIYDAEGKAIQTIARNSNFALTAVGDGLLTLDQNKLAEIDIATGKERRSTPISNAYNAKLLAAEEGSIYLLSDTGVQKLNAQGDAFTEVCDGAKFLFGDPVQAIQGACALANGDFALLLTSGESTRMTRSVSSGGVSFSTSEGTAVVEQSHLMWYQYDASLDLGTQRDFIITALRGSAKLRKAVSEFQRAHPELNVKLMTSLDESDYETPTEDAIRTLNTAILAGKGGDVLVMDGLPLRQYIDKGVLTPIDGALEGIDFLPGIFAGSHAADGHIYAMPAQFMIQTIWGNKSVVSDIDSLSALVNIPLEAGQTAMRACSPGQWLEMMYPASESAFRDGDGKLRFTTPEFEQFLELLYNLYSAQIDPVEEEFEKAAAGMPNLDAMQAMMNHAIALYDSQIGGTMQPSFCYTAGGGDENVGVQLIPSLNGTGTMYIPGLLLGINAQTQNEALAAEFIQLMYEQDMQAIDQMDGMPTTKTALDSLFAEAITRNDQQNEMKMMISDGVNTFEINQPDTATWSTLRALCDEISVPYIEDTTLLDFMVSETALFFEGRMDAAQAAQALQQRAEAYLNE